MEQRLIASFGDFGLLVVIGSVLLDQIGLPFPALPVLILAGALAAHSDAMMLQLFLGAILGCLIADLGWFLAGRRYGTRVMRLLCRISISPDSCVSETQLRFERWGSPALLLAKFIPGLSLIAPPLAGATRMGVGEFLLFSELGSALWAGAGLGVGRLFKPQIDRMLPQLQRIGSGLGLLLLAALLAYIGVKWLQRRRFYAQLRMARISVAELYELIGAGAAPMILDVRSSTAHALDPRIIPGAQRISLSEIGRQLEQLPRDREIVLYCTCPNEASAAQVAKVLLNHGFRHVRPLQGGLDAWIAAGYSAAAPASPALSAVVTVAET
jgi:membrane protein DedA with SNARE-associated domain/rhodanese-related sulfurtransferase